MFDEWVLCEDGLPETDVDDEWQVYADSPEEMAMQEYLEEQLLDAFTDDDATAFRNDRVMYG